MIIQDRVKIKIKEFITENINNITIRDQHLSEEEKKGLQNCTKKFSNLFSDPNNKLTFTSVVKGEIRTNSDKPIYSKTYPYPISLKSEVDKQINDLLKDGIIRKSRSPYNAPVWVVPKKLDASGEKKYRLVIDYRKLNAITIPDRYPMPEISEVISQIRNCKYYTVIDLKSGFHQIPLKEEDMEKTAFSVNGGKYKFTRLPFGLKNAPSIFQRTLDDILRSFIGKSCFVYIDDIVIFSKDLSTHLKDIESIFSTLEKANMKVQPDKCEFMKSEVEFLGFIISEHGIKTNPNKTKAISEFPVPKTIKDLRSFLGLSGYYRRFIRDYAKIAKPLTILLRGEEGRYSKNMSAKIRIELDSEALEAFNKIKNTLISDDVVLKYPDYNKPFQLTTDASDYAIGAVLAQEDKPIMFISRTLNSTEERYAINEKEMLAIVWALDTFRNYLYGTAFVKLYTDHQTLTGSLRSKNNNAKMKRWKNLIEEYNHELIYKPGKANVVADRLSRPPCEINNNMTISQHSDSTSGENLIKTAEEPVNVYKNQIFLQLGEQPSWEFKIIFPTYHRFVIKEPEYSEEKLLEILKKCLNPSVINGINTDEEILGKIQRIYPMNLAQYKIRYARRVVEDILEENRQEEIIINEHNRAHRNGLENKLQIIRRAYFPQLRAKIEKIVKQCKICKENKYDRHPNKTPINETPIPQFPGHIIHIDLYFTNKNVLLTAIDKFSKYAQVRILKSRAIEDVKGPLREVILSFGTPTIVAIDNEKTFNSSVINFMLENQFGIRVYKTPPYSSTANGQVERFHSTFTEILRCLQAEKVYDSFSELIDLALYKYNHSIHSTTKKKPVETFFGRTVPTNERTLEEDKKEKISKLEKNKDRI